MARHATHQDSPNGRIAYAIFLCNRPSRRPAAVRRGPREEQSGECTSTASRQPAATTIDLRLLRPFGYCSHRTPNSQVTFLPVVATSPRTGPNQVGFASLPSFGNWSSFAWPIIVSICDSRELVQVVRVSCSSC